MRTLLQSSVDTIYTNFMLGKLEFSDLETLSPDMKDLLKEKFRARITLNSKDDIFVYSKDEDYLVNWADEINYMFLEIPDLREDLEEYFNKDEIFINKTVPIMMGFLNPMEVEIIIPVSGSLTKLFQDAPGTVIKSLTKLEHILFVEI